MKQKSKSLFGILTIIFLLIPIIAGAVNFNQFVTIKPDGSGTLKIVYAESDAVIKEKNSLIGNLPFLKDKLNEYFSSTNVQVTESVVEKSPKDNTMTQISVTMNFKDINELNTLKGFANIRYGFAKSDTGYIYRNNITADFIRMNSIDQIYSSLYSSTVVKSSNGNVKDKQVVWFTGKIGNLTKDQVIGYVATLTSTGNNAGDKNSPKDAPGDDKGKSCGLFGIELPFVVLLGMVLINRSRKK